MSETDKNTALAHLKVVTRILSDRPEEALAQELVLAIHAIEEDVSCRTCRHKDFKRWLCLWHSEDIPEDWRGRGCEKYQPEPSSPF